MKRRALVGVAGALVVVAIVTFAVTRAVRQHDAAVGGGVRSGPSASEDGVSPQEMYRLLSADERRAVDSVQGADAKALFTRLYYLANNRLSGDAGELSPFLDAVEAHRVLAPKEAETSAWRDSYLQTVPSLTFLARAWVQVGPFPGMRERLIAGAVKCGGERDETLKYGAACLLITLRDYPPSPLPPEANNALESLLNNDYVNHLITTRWYGEMDKAAVAVGRAPRPK